jgi:predicted dienelactone hydrolase
VAVGQPGEDPAVAGSWRRDRVLLGREYDLRAALDAVLADPVLAAHIDRRRIGAAGLGLGGYAALLLGGGKPDLLRLAAFCEANLNPSCAADATPPMVRAGLAPFRDERIKALVLMAPEPGYVFADDGLREVVAPVRIYRAGSDHRPSAPYDAERIRRLLPDSPDYVEIENAGPEAFLAPCSAAQRHADPQSCIDSPKLDRAALHARINAEMADFFRRTLGPSSPPP